jgi:hypothetical protein
MTWHVIPHHINLGPHISMSKKSIKIYLCNMRLSKTTKKYLIQNISIN